LTNGFKVNPFSQLSSDGTVNGEPDQSDAETISERVSDHTMGDQRVRETLVLRLEKKGRRGKVVTLISGFTQASEEEIEGLARRLRMSLGTGGTVCNKVIELQGDRRESASEVLRKQGFGVKCTT